MLVERIKSSQPTIMVVEDFDDTRFLMKTSLEMKGYRVVEADNGQKAVEIAKREKPNLIFMDLNLPVLDGITATRLIREYAPLRDVPIVAVTNYTGYEYRKQALAAGCNEFLNKPFDFDQLDDLLSNLLPLS